MTAPAGRRSLRLRAAAALAALAAALLLAACGYDDESGSVTTTTTFGNREEAIVGSSNGDFDPQRVYSEAAPGVVTIRSVFGGDSSAGILGGGRAAGQGSGFVVSDEGEIVTNAHVVTDAQASGGGDISAADEVYVEFPDRNQVPAEIVGFDPFADVALLQVDTDGLEIHPLELGSSSEIEVGQPVAAIGSPFGEENSLSVGVVSQAGRSVESLTDFQIDDAIQTDAAINPGNSGGPLLDAQGRVIGVNSQIASSGGGNSGVGFAVPVDTVRDVVPKLLKDGKMDRAYLGLASGERPATPGALVGTVNPGAPAAEAGIRTGDLIVSFDGKRIRNPSELSLAVLEKQPGDKVKVELRRGDSSRTVTVELGKRPDQLAR